MQIVYSNFFDLYKKIIDKHRRGEGEGVRWITYIDKANKDFVNIFLNAGAQVRHIKAKVIHKICNKIAQGNRIRLVHFEGDH